VAFSIHERQAQNITMMNAKLTSFYKTLKYHYAPARPLTGLDRKDGLRMPRSRVTLIEQRFGGATILTYEEKEPIRIYKLLNRAGEGDEATAVAMQELDCAHFRNFARNFSPEDVERMERNRSTQFFPTDNEKILAQYFVELHVRERRLAVTECLRRMKLLMPYRTDEFVKDLFNIWNVPGNDRRKFATRRSPEPIRSMNFMGRIYFNRMTRGRAIEQIEHLLRYNAEK